MLLIFLHYLELSRNGDRKVWGCGKDIRVTRFAREPGLDVGQGKLLPLVLVRHGGVFRRKDVLNCRCHDVRMIMTANNGETARIKLVVQAKEP